MSKSTSSRHSSHWSQFLECSMFRSCPPGERPKSNLRLSIGPGQQTKPDGQKTCIDLEYPSSANQRELQGLLCRPNRHRTSKEQCAQSILFITCSCTCRNTIRVRGANLTCLFRPLSVIVPAGPAVYCRRLGHPGSHHPQTIIHCPVSQKHWTGTETQAAFAMYAVFAAQGRPRLSNGEQVWNTRSARRSATQSMAPAGYKQLIKTY